VSDALTTARPATVRLVDVTLTSGAAAPFGPITVVADAAGLCFWRPGDTEGRALPWPRVRRIRVDGGDGGTTVLVATASGVHHLWVPRAHPARTADALAAVAGAVPVTYRPPNPPPDAAAAPEVPAPPAASRATSNGPVRPATTAAPAWFLRARPALTVVLVVAVSAMVALVLAASAGAIHLGWLGGGAGGQIPPAH
jgi:hypothetical protein